MVTLFRYIYTESLGICYIANINIHDKYWTCRQDVLSIYHKITAVDDRKVVVIVKKSSSQQLYSYNQHFPRSSCWIFFIGKVKSSDLDPTGLVSSCWRSHFKAKYSLLTSADVCGFADLSQLLNWICFQVIRYDSIGKFQCTPGMPVSFSRACSKSESDQCGFSSFAFHMINNMSSHSKYHSVHVNLIWWICLGLIHPVY